MIRIRRIPNEDVDLAIKLGVPVFELVLDRSYCGVGPRGSVMFSHVDIPMYTTLAIPTEEHDEYLSCNRTCGEPEPDCAYFVREEECDS